MLFKFPGFKAYQVSVEFECFFNFFFRDPEVYVVDERHSRDFFRGDIYLSGTDSTVDADSLDRLFKG